MKHSLLILISFLLLSSPVIGNNHKGETLYMWETSSGKVWKGFGEKDTNPVYKGDVKDGKPDGLGFLIYPDGRKYVGGWKDGERNGQGTFTIIFRDFGIKYVGEWKDGKKNGQGTQTNIDGTMYEGEWKDGEMWNGILYDKEGNIKYKFVNGKVIKQ